MLRLFASHAAQQFQRHAANRAFSALAASAAGGMGGVAARRWGSVWKKCRLDAAAAAPTAATCGAPFDCTQAPYPSTVDLDFTQLTPLAFARRFSAGPAASGGDIGAEHVNKPPDKAAANGGNGIGSADNVYLHHTNVGSNVQAAAVTVGLIHALEPLCPGIGYFRPIDCTTHGGNRAELMRKIFRLTPPARDMYGVTQDRATTLLHANRVDDLLDDVLMSYERCRREHDFMVVEGTSLKDGTISAPVNGLIASALGAPAILLTDARVAAESSHPNFTMEEIDWEADAAQSMLDHARILRSTHVHVAGSLIYRAPSDSFSTRSNSGTTTTTGNNAIGERPSSPRGGPRSPHSAAMRSRSPSPPRSPPRSALRSAHGSAHPLRFTSRSASRPASRSGPRLRDYIEAHSRSQAYIHPSEEHQHQPIPVLGIIPEDSSLQSLSVEDLRRAVLGEVLYGPESAFAAAGKAGRRSISSNICSGSSSSVTSGSSSQYFTFPSMTPAVAATSRHVSGSHDTSESSSCHVSRQMGRGPRVAQMDVTKTVVATAPFHELVDEIPSVCDYNENGVYSGSSEGGVCIVTHASDTDVLLGAMQLSQAKADKRVAAVVLSGGTPPTLTIDHMIRSTNLSASLPVLLSPLDPHVICLSIARAHSSLHASSPAKIRRARDLFQEHADTPAIHRILFQEASSANPAHVTPRVFECGIFSRARKAQSHVVLAKGTEPKVVQAAGEVLRRSLCKLTLLGNPEEVLLQAKNQCVDLSGANIVDPGASPDLDRYVELICQAQLERGVTMSVEEARRLLLSDPASFGSAMVAAGEADGMAVGGIRPNGNGKIVRGVIKTRPEMPVVSGVVFMCLPDKVLVYGDSVENTLPLIGSNSTAVAPSLGASAPTNGIATADPTAEELAMIAMSSADTAAAFGVEPRVALLSRQPNQQGVSRGHLAERIEEAAHIVKEQRPDLAVEGPLPYATAVGDKKRSGSVLFDNSDVAGKATVLIFPDIHSSTDMYKQQHTSGGVAMGTVLQGLRRPVSDVTNSDTVRDLVTTIAITGVQAATMASDPGASSC
ncbi:unnamed protein product [Closterium sp. NIES-53]